jgi:hypothetical protein
LLHAGHFLLKIAAPQGREAIGLLAARAVFVFEAFDPAVFEEAAQRAVKGAGAEADAAIADALGVLKNGVAVTWLRGEAEKDEEDGFSHRFEAGYHTSLRDMSFNDILSKSDREVKAGVKPFFRIIISKVL